MKCRLLAGLSLLMLVTLAPTLAQAYTLSAPFTTVGVGDTFTIPISVTGATELTSWQFDLGFDPAIVNATLVTEGAFLSSFGSTLFIEGAIDNVDGLISLLAGSFVDLPPSPFGDGVLANIQFLALAPGVSPLDFSNAFLNLSDTGFDIASGQITVTGAAPVPEPGTLMLLAAGLGLIGLRRLARRGVGD